MNQTITEAALEDVAEGPVSGIGNQLRQMREDRQLSIEAVANDLHLTKQRIIEIEQEDFSNMASVAYARGYVRAYARLLGGPVEEILVAFDGIEHSSNRPKRSVFLPRRNRLSTGHPYMRWVTALICLALIAMVVIWGSNQYDSLQSSNGESTSLNIQVNEEASE